MHLNAKENYLEAVKYGKPEYVPMSCEPVWQGINFNDMLKYENWTDRFGVEWEMAAADTVPFPKGNPLADIERQLDSYKFPDPNELVMNPETLEHIKTLDRGAVLLSGGLSYFCFERAWALMGMDNFFAAIIEYPGEVKYMLHKIAGYARGVFDRYLEMGVDGVGFSEDLGTQRALMISPKHFREFFIPEYKYAFENVLKEGKFVNFHSCGCVSEIAGDLADIGVTILNPVQAKANDLHKIKKDAHGKMALSGGIDTHLILTGTPDEIKKETERVMEILKPGGGYICGPDQYFPDMPRENIQMLWQTARETGKYV
jgi:uroporphyrinogen decarboxylase